MASLSALKVEELDELAESHGVAEYPAEGVKAEKVAALEAAGVAGPDAKYRFRLNEETLERLNSDDLRDELRFVRFWAGDKAVDLRPDRSEYETRDSDVAAGLRSLPFLEAVD